MRLIGGIRRDTELNNSGNHLPRGVFRRAGVSEGEIQKLCGWATRSMFDRYNIIDGADGARSVAKRFGNQLTNKEPSKNTPDSVTSKAVSN